MSFPKQELCCFCQAGFTSPITAKAKFSTRNLATHPGFPQSRLCAITHLDCGAGTVECIAWDPSPTTQFNQVPPTILISHRLHAGGSYYVERPRIPISYDQLATAGLQLVVVRQDTSLWRYEFVPV